MLSCKDVAHLASDYLDKNVGVKLSWKIRLHLTMCKCCRRFIKHLEITKIVVPHFLQNHEQSKVDAETVLKNIKANTESLDT